MRRDVPQGKLSRARLSLRWRLLLTIGLVVAAAMAAVGWFMQRVVELEFEHCLTLDSEVAAPPVATFRAYAAPLVRHHAANGWRDIGPLLARLAAGLGERHQLLLFDSQGVFVVASDARFANVVLTPLAAGEIELRWRRGVAEGVVRLRAPRLDLVSGDGEVLDFLQLLPLPEEAEVEEGALFLASLDRWVFGGVRPAAPASASPSSSSWSRPRAAGWGWKASLAAGRASPSPCRWRPGRSIASHDE